MSHFIVALFVVGWSAVLLAGLWCSQTKPWEWVMKCPHCKQYMRKQDPAAKWSCPCGWRE